MSAEVTDQALLAKLNGEAPPAAGAAGEVTDPAVLAKLNAEYAHNAPPVIEDKLPFGDQVHLAQSDNIEEKELYFQYRYGKDAVKREWGDNGDPTLVVKTSDGKTFRVGGGTGQTPGFVAQIVGDAPQLIGMAGGAGAGVEGGPLGMVVGAGVGAMGGKTLLEGQKSALGIRSKDEAQGLGALSEAGLQGAEGEMGGAVVGKLGAKLLTAHLPKFITGATDKSVAMTRDAWAGGAWPPYASMGPDLTKLRRIEVVAEKLTGRYARQDERNMAYVKSELAEKLAASGMPKQHVEAFLKEIDGPEYAVSHRDVGEQLQKSVEAHIESLTEAVQKSAKLADSHIDAQLGNIRSRIDASTHADLTGDVAALIESAHKDFTSASSALYDKALKLAGTDKIVPTDLVATEADKIVDVIRETAPSQIPRIVQEMSKLAGKPLNDRDAILLQEFGIEIPETGKMSLKGAQRLRTILRQKAGAQDFTHNTTQHDYGQLASAVDQSIQDAAADPAAKPAIEALNTADAFYKRNVGKFNDARIDALMSQIRSGSPPDPEKLVDMLTRTGLSSRTSALRRMVGEDVWKRVQSVHLQKFMRRFEVTTPEGTREVDGMKLLQNLQDGDGVQALRTIHGQESVTQLREVAQLIAARRGKIDPAVLVNGGPKAAVEQLRAQEAKFDDFMKKNALAILADPTKTGEQAYQWLARPHGAGGDESRLLAAMRLFGENSPQMAGLRQAALEDVARNASIHAIDKQGNGAIERAMKEYSSTQTKLLFPDGIAADMHHLSDVIKFMFPFKSGEASDTGMAGMHVGSVMELPLRQRLYAQAVGAVTRFVALHPTAARWLVTGRKEGEFAWMRRTAAVIQKMAAVTSAEDAGPDTNQTSQAPPSTPAPPTLQ
jgi:hypothetical protein